MVLTRIHRYQVLGIFKGHMLTIIIIYNSSQNGLDLNQQLLGIGYFQRSHALYHCHICVISKWSSLESTSIRYQVFSKAMCFISLSYMSHIEKVLSISLINKYQVLGIFKGHVLHIIVIYESSQNGLVFYINQQVLGIRYFQRSCASYYHHI